MDKKVMKSKTSMNKSRTGSSISTEIPIPLFWASNNFADRTLLQLDFQCDWVWQYQTCYRKIVGHSLEEHSHRLPWSHWDLHAQYLTWDWLKYSGNHDEGTNLPIEHFDVLAIGWLTPAVAYLFALESLVSIVLWTLHWNTRASQKQNQINTI